MAEPSKKEKIKHTLEELKAMGKQIVEMAELFEKHIEELEREIEKNNGNKAQPKDA